MPAWLKDNSAALQGMAALLSLPLTLVVIAITWRYVRLTKKLAETSYIQLSASLQPIITFELENVSEGKGYSLGHESYSLSPTVTIQNAGKAPVKIKQITLVLQSWLGPFRQREYKIEKDRNRVLLPDEKLTGMYDVETEVDYSPVRHQWIIGLKIECTDLSETVLHTFAWHPIRGMFHSSTAEPRFQALKVVERVARYIKRWAEFENS